MDAEAVLELNSKSSAALCLFFFLFLSRAAQKSNAESNDIWSEACKTERKYVPTKSMYNVWPIGKSFCYGHVPDVGQVDLQMCPDLCKVRSLHSGDNLWLPVSSNEVQMLVQSQYRH